MARSSLAVILPHNERYRTWLLLFITCVVSLLAVQAATVSSSNESVSTYDNSIGTLSSRSSYYQIPWEADIFHLPANVAFPGADWLHRLATASDPPPEDTMFLFQETLYSSVYAAMLKNQPLEYPCRNFNAYLNSLLFRPRLAKTITTYIVGRSNSPVRLDVAHYVLCYLRNLIGALLVYYGTAGVFHYFCYLHGSSRHIFEAQNRARPGARVMRNQIQLAQSSMFLYVLLPCVDEFVIEAGWTRVYYTVAEIGGWLPYVLYTVCYFAAVEIGIYWMHRSLHTNKWLYRNIHQLHHQYNKPEALTPWASIAFHPLDGILQASPYVLVLPWVPCHYLTHFLLLFFTAVWATYIHDGMDWNVGHVMGSKYHTVHHTHYIYNYGQVFTFCDRWWGTFCEPSGPTGVKKEGKHRARDQAKVLSGRASGTNLNGSVKVE